MTSQLPRRPRTQPDALITYVEPWPVQLARDDLRSSVALFYYARYGLTMREALEVKGPYEFRPQDSRYFNGLGVLGTSVFADDVEYFERHKRSVESAATNQLVVACYAVVEFLIANLVLFLYFSAREKKSPDHGFQVVWDPAERERFLADPRVDDVQSQQWMRRHYRAREQEKRIDLLAKVGVTLRDFSRDRDGTTLDWSWFENARQLRHNVAHAAGRMSLYDNPQLEHHEITPSELLNIEDFVTTLLTHVTRQLYEVPVIRYVHV